MLWRSPLEVGKNQQGGKSPMGAFVGADVQAGRGKHRQMGRCVCGGGGWGGWKCGVGKAENLVQNHVCMPAAVRSLSFLSLAASRTEEAHMKEAT